MCHLHLETPPHAGSIDLLQRTPIQPLWSMRKCVYTNKSGFQQFHKTQTCQSLFFTYCSIMEYCLMLLVWHNGGVDAPFTQQHSLVPVNVPFSNTRKFWREENKSKVKKCWLVNTNSTNISHKVIPFRKPLVLLENCVYIRRVFAQIDSLQTREIKDRSTHATSEKRKREREKDRNRIDYHTYVVLALCAHLLEATWHFVPQLVLVPVHDKGSHGQAIMVVRSSPIPKTLHLLVPKERQREWQWQWVRVREGEWRESQLKNILYEK